MTAERAVDVVVGLLVAAVGGLLLAATDHTFFAGDDWGLLHQGLRAGGLLEPYNDHLSILILGLYRVLAEMFGLVYLPFRIAGTLCLVTIPVLLYATTRSRFGPAMAGGLALVVLGVPRIELQPFVLNHYLMAIGAIVSAWALNRGAAIAVAVGLTIALSAAGGGVAVAIACVIHCLWTRPPLRLWVATVVPIGLWMTWYAHEWRGSDYRPAARPSVGDLLEYARNVILSPFEGAVGLALAISTLAFVACSWRRRFISGANVVAWGGALAAWGVGLAYNRGPVGTVDVYGRYELVALLFLLLALVPQRPLPRLPRAWSWAAPASLVVAAVLLWTALRPTVDDKAAWSRELAKLSECTTLHGGPDTPFVAMVTEVVAHYGTGEARCEEDEGAP